MVAQEMVNVETMPAIDRTHLARQTLGNLELQREVLTLFAAQADQVLRDLEDTSVSDEVRREAAHSLVGSARGVGAFAVADAAATIERGEGPPAPTRLRALRHAVAEARAEIEVILRG